jgi:L-arabinokinase
MRLGDLEQGGHPISYAEARNSFKKDPDRAWAAYVAGSFLVLMREKGVVFPQGARILIDSSVPEGKGVASSAAIEVAVMMAVGAAFNLNLEPGEVANLCQKVENLVVGAPCGIMDQMTSVFGEENRLLSLLCQPAEIQASLAIPDNLSFWGIDSGIRHAVSGADYTSVRVGAFMGYTILKKLANNDWGGYLANLTPSELEQKYLSHLPEAIKGSDFLARYGSTDDTVTEVDPDVTYAVRQPTAHPVYEHFRLRAFSRLLAGDAVANGPLLGELMYDSHASYSDCGLGSEGTNTLVDLARQAGPERGIFGAKITGGGCGGTVAILGRRDAGPAVQTIAETYAQTTGRKPNVFTGSSPGAAAFGHLHL